MYNRHETDTSHSGLRTDGLLRRDNRSVDGLCYAEGGRRHIRAKGEGFQSDINFYILV